MGCVRLSSRDPRCYHSRLPCAPCCWELPLWSRVPGAAAVLCSWQPQPGGRNTDELRAGSVLSSRYVCLGCLCYGNAGFGEKRGVDRWVIMPSATLTGLSEPPASSNSIPALPPHLQIFCFSNINTNFPVANSKPLSCCLPCAHPNVQKS